MPKHTKAKSTSARRLRNHPDDVPPIPPDPDPTPRKSPLDTNPFSPLDDHESNEDDDVVGTTLPTY
jgi:hypothetical protein